MRKVSGGNVRSILPSAHCNKGAEARRRRWGLILAGGDGTRLQTLTRLICGDERPKQFCRLFDDRTLLSQSVCRAERSIPVAQILFALTHSHHDFYTHELDDFRSQRIVQPANKGTAPPILFSLLSVARMDEDALVAVLPSDHHYRDEARFTAALESAFDVAARRSESVVILGAQPTRPEMEYGWIELGLPAGDEYSELFHARAFLEKPSLEIAQLLLGRHSAWNTFVMVGHVGAFLEMTAHAIPDVLDVIRQTSLWSGSETFIEDSAYKEVGSIDFSQAVLSRETRRLLILRVRDLGWSDLGSPGRVLALFEGRGFEPRWMREWTQPTRTEAATRPVAKPTVA